jgi:RNA polymerase subunit RPABC4/transcription elongation factor Spt4
MRCRRCGAHVKAGLTLCPECGAATGRRKPLAKKLYCQSCQRRVPAGLNICPYCGARLRRSWRPLFLAVGTALAVLAAAYLALNYVPWELVRELPQKVQPPSFAFLATRTFTPMPTATRTATRTRTGTPTLTVTPTATEVISTDTPTQPPPTATRQPIPTRTPTPGSAAPLLVSPDDQAEFHGGGSRIELAWRAVDGLADDEWYALSVRFLTDGVVQYAGTWTKDTAWLLPSDLHGKAGQNERAFQWDVTVMRQSGTKPDGGREGTALGPASETRTVYWY